VEPLTLIFIGMSGSGKGTQIELLSEYLERKDKTAHAAIVKKLKLG
jgi:adenylate kinase family enzyme